MAFSEPPVATRGRYQEGTDVHPASLVTPTIFRRDSAGFIFFAPHPDRLLDSDCLRSACARGCEQISMRLKRKEARDGYERRFPGLGMPRRNDGEEGSRGDLIVHFMAEGDAES